MRSSFDGFTCTSPTSPRTYSRVAAPGYSVRVIVPIGTCVSCSTLQPGTKTSAPASATHAAPAAAIARPPLPGAPVPMGILRGNPHRRGRSADWTRLHAPAEEPRADSRPLDYAPAPSLQFDRGDE